MHEAIDFWDITFRTRRFLGSTYLSTIGTRLRPKALLYMYNKLHPQIQIPNACYVVYAVGTWVGGIMGLNLSILKQTSYQTHELYV